MDDTLAIHFRACKIEERTYLPIRQRLDQVLGEYPHALDPREPYLHNELVTVLKLN
jgi:hypothetical protein